MNGERCLAVEPGRCQAPVIGGTQQARNRCPNAILLKSKRRSLAAFASQERCDLCDGETLQRHAGAVKQRDFLAIPPSLA